MSKFISIVIITIICDSLMYDVNGTSTISGNIEVSTSQGKIKGLVLDFGDGKGVNLFLGVPFAAPPIGELRWKKPQKPQWSGVYDATYFRPVCYAFSSRYNMSEDCLHLNIYAPYKGVGDGPFPVMFWIHGGGYSNGAAREFPGFFLAQRGVVIVTVNYRLQALGFMTTEDTVAPGNYGMWDQNAGLKFVKENIEAFGGDPDDITIFGQSAGGASTALHLLSPHSQGLIKKAVPHSGGDLATWAMVDPKWKPSDYARELAEDLGCPTSDNTAMLDCLRQIHPAEITSAAEAVYADIKIGAVHIPFSPVVDGPGGFLPDTPINIRQQGGFAKIPVMTGITTNEGAGIFGSDELNRQEFLDSIRDLVEAVAMNNTDQQHDALNFEYTYWPDANNGSINRQSFADITSDALFGAPVDAVAKSQANYSDTYHYVFGYRSKNDPSQKWTAVSHTGEVQFVFGHPFYDETTMKIMNSNPSFNYTAEDQEFSANVMEAWTNFAKYGNPTPSPVCGVTWPKFTKTDLLSLHFDHVSNIIRDFRQHKWAFWREFVPKIVNYSICPSANSSLNLRHYESAEHKRRSYHRNVNTFLRVTLSDKTVF